MLSKQTFVVEERESNGPLNNDTDISVAGRVEGGQKYRIPFGFGAAVRTPGCKRPMAAGFWGTYGVAGPAACERSGLPLQCAENG